MRLILLISSLVVLLMAPARADLPLSEQDRIWGMILGGDYPALEAELQRVHRNSVETGQFQQVRNYNKMFETTHPRATETLRAWQDEMPDSVYAQMAMFWHRFHIAWQIRGTQTINRTHPDAVAAFSAFTVWGRDIAGAAYVNAPDYVAASDAVMTMGKPWDGEALHAFVREIMQTTPNAGSLRRGYLAAHPNWGGSWGLITRICELAYLTDEASVDDCFARANLDMNRGFAAHIQSGAYFVSKYMNGDTSGMQFDLAWLYSQDPSAFDASRQADVAAAILEKAESGGDYNEMLETADLLRLNSRKRHDIYAQVEKIAARSLQRQFERDPYNIQYAMDRARHEMPPTRNGARAQYSPQQIRRAFGYWKNATRYGARRSAVWLQGANLVRHLYPEDANAKTFAFHVNAIAYENPPVIAALQMMSFYNHQYKGAQKLKKGEPYHIELESDPDTVIETVRCPLLRAARLLKLACERNSNPQLNSYPCNSDSGALDTANAISTDMQIIRACPKEAVLPKPWLKYDPVPEAEIGAWFDAFEAPD